MSSSTSLSLSLASISNEVEALVSARLNQLKSNIRDYHQIPPTITSATNNENDSNDDESENENEAEDKISATLMTSDDSHSASESDEEKINNNTNSNEKEIAQTSNLSLKDRRSKLPLRCVYILREWFSNHVNHPYPNEIEKRELALLTGLTVKQVACWMTNCRRRIWQPYKNSTIIEIQTENHSQHEQKLDC